MIVPAFKSARYSKMRRILELTLRTAARIPVIHGLVEVDVTTPRALLAAHRERTGETLSFTAFIVHCLAVAVIEFPAVHALRAGSHALRIYDDIDIAVLIERDLDGAKQPIIPIVRSANRLSLLEIHTFIRKAQTQPVEEAWKTIPAFAWVPYWAFWLAWPFFWRRVRRDPELHRKYRGTVGVSAVGMFGTGGGWGIPITDNTSVTVGGIATRPAYVDGLLVPREFLSLTLSFDHATIDGAVAARFANRLRELIEAGQGLPGA